LTRNEVKEGLNSDLITGEKVRSVKPPMKFYVRFDRRLKVTIKENVTIKICPGTRLDVASAFLTIIEAHQARVRAEQVFAALLTILTERGGGMRGTARRTARAKSSLDASRFRFQ
jgi:hypothetical protein